MAELKFEVPDRVQILVGTSASSALSEAAVPDLFLREGTKARRRNVEK
ncbi:MAG TPA: hypothetical protein VFP12_07610 [Allosphingosinicella sp.]|nr:hypothetical protein [Allosphingosinicella sp.]